MAEKQSIKWATRNGTFLIETETFEIPFVSGGVGLEGAPRFDRSAAYVEKTIAGEIVSYYDKPLPFGIEDEMTVSNIHLVIEDSLYRFYWSRQYPFAARLEVRLLLYGLRRHDGELPFEEGG